MACLIHRRSKWESFNKKITIIKLAGVYCAQIFEKKIKIESENHVNVSIYIFICFPFCLQADIFLSNEEVLQEEFQTSFRKEEIKDEQLSYRLPKTVKPHHYTLKLQPFLSGDFNISGYVEILVEALEPTSYITMHINDIITHNDTVRVSILFKIYMLNN